ncbi:MAG: putative porin [Nitrospiria bacterium]
MNSGERSLPSPHQKNVTQILFQSLTKAVLLASFFLLHLHTGALARESVRDLKDLLIEKGVLSKEEAASLRETPLSDWIDRMRMSGDFRLRQESIWKTPGSDRSRQRFRLRMAMNMNIDNFQLGIRIASGAGEQASANQSFDSLFSQKPLWIDRAYLSWKQISGLTLSAGKMPNPFYRVYTTDIIWDSDVNPEGFAEQLVMKPFDKLDLFINLGQFVLDEDSTDNNDQWLFGEQLGGRISFTGESRLTFAASYYSLENATTGAFGQNAVQEGNTRVSPSDRTLVNPFRVLDLTADFSTKLGCIPLALQADYVRNLAGTTTGEDTGYQFGVRIGKAKAPRTWELAYFYKKVETDATVADLADSDFGDGGTNRRGNIFWIAHQISKPLLFKIKFLNTEVEDESLPPGKDDVDRVQIDLALKF